MSKKGLVQIYKGDYDKIHFVPMGLSLRAAGHNLKTYMTSFLSHGWMDGARMASILLRPNLVIEHTEIEDMPPDGKWGQREMDEINQSFQRAKEALLGNEFDIVILNGINQISYQGVISLKDILELVRQRPDNVELVLTGPDVDEELLERADLVTEMVCYDPKERSSKGDEHIRITPTEVVTGNGKGKTTYSLGKAMLMSCLGIRSIILQFIKSPKPYGEVKSIEKLPYMEIKTMGEGFLNRRSRVPNKRHLTAARRTWEACLREIFSLQYGLIILDEINIATHFGLIHPERVREMLYLKPQNLHIILSGRNAHPEVREGASSVIEMREIKHPFKKGIKARKGIEF